jgi:replicative DNA helicase
MAINGTSNGNGRKSGRKSSGKNGRNGFADAPDYSRPTDAAGVDVFDKLPPHDVGAEMCLLASLMLDKEAVGDIAPSLRASAFYLPQHALTYEIIVALFNDGKAIDSVIVRDELIKKDKYDEVGGSNFIANLLGSVPSAAHARHYADIVRDKATLRMLISASNSVLREAYGEHEDAKMVLEDAEKKFFEIAENKVSTDLSRLGEVAMDVYETIYDRGHKGVETEFPDLDDMLNGLQPGEMIIVAARPSMGKAQPLDSRVLTTSGWQLMGNLSVGDELASVDGEPSHVTGIYPQGRRQVYRITFADGRSTECCAEHLWRVHFRGWDEPRVLETRQLVEMLGKQRYQNRLWIDTFAGEFGNDDDLPIDPWLLGLLLAEGRLGGSSVRFSSADEQVVAQVGQAAGDDLELVAAGGVDYRIKQAGGAAVAGVQGSGPNPLKTALVSLNLWEKNAHEKFVPPAYLGASHDSRRRLLAGLLDGDGWVETFGAVRFATSSRRLADDVVALARSLGGTARWSIKQPTYRHDGKLRQGRPSYVCNLQHREAASWFTLPRKQSRLAAGRQRQRRLNIQSIQPTRVTQTQCISVSHPSRLYVTDDYIVTHNTAFAMNIVQNVAAKHIPCAVFSLEMSKQQLAQRMLCSRADVDGHKVRKGMLSTDEYHRLAQVVNELDKFPIWVDDSPGLTLLELRAKARRLARQHGIKLIMIDYMQLMDNPGVESRQQQISEISRGIKAVARELKIPVVCLSQLNRQSEGRDGHRPRMSDLRESGSIEQDADVVALLHREDYYRQNEPDFVPTNEAEIIIAKQRNGPTGTVRLMFDNKTTSFKPLASQADSF